MIKFDFNKTPITQIADYIIISSARSNAFVWMEIYRTLHLFQKHMKGT